MASSLHATLPRASDRGASAFLLSPLRTGYCVRFGVNMQWGEFQDTAGRLAQGATEREMRVVS